MEEVGFVCLVTQVLWLEGVLYTGHWPADVMSALVDANGFKTLRVLICVTKVQVQFYFYSIFHIIGLLYHNFLVLL